jgi:uncharacterized protein GlcG (DUF336 family)
MTTSLKLLILPYLRRLGGAAFRRIQRRCTGRDFQVQLAPQSCQRGSHRGSTHLRGLWLCSVGCCGRRLRSGESPIEGDHSTVHTKDTSFRKAYTLVTMGPVLGLGSGSEFADFLRSNPNASALQQIPDIISLPGSVAIRAHGEIVAAIAVGDAPGGEKDEDCARAGLANIAARLPR